PTRPPPTTTASARVARLIWRLRRSAPGRGCGLASNVLGCCPGFSTGGEYEPATRYRVDRGCTPKGTGRPYGPKGTGRPYGIAAGEASNFRRRILGIAHSFPPLHGAPDDPRIDVRPSRMGG